jgi:hypothetical protein
MAKTPPLSALSVALEDWWDETVHPMYEFANYPCSILGDALPSRDCLPHDRWSEEFQTDRSLQ